MTNLECIEYASKHSFKGLYEKGRAEAIDEVMKECERFRNQFKSFYYSDFVRIAEQLKEAKSETTN